MPASKSNIVKRSLDPNRPPPLTEEQRKRLDAVAAMPEERIDYSDAPFLPDAVWVKAAKLPGTKQQITLRVDSDVLEFFRHSGKRYQTRINAVLRAYVEAHRTSAAAR
ncbi:MAG: BrnA antitoxin family protein [Candidatus Accumulibacter sp.]|jgi:uncharacterized protein (DUF4415 family)|nr:BrnA antitoxin family protein [Accumulibacter sp.]